MTDDTKPRDHGQWRPVVTIAAIALGGPVAGMIAVLAALGLWLTFDTSVSSGSLMPLLAFHPFSWMLAYVVGGIPAAIGGAAYVALDRWVRPTLPREPLAAVIGAGGMLVFLLMTRGSGGDWRSDLALSASSAVAAAVMAFLTRRWRYRRNT